MNPISACSTYIAPSFSVQNENIYEVIKTLGAGERGVVELRKGHDGYWAFKKFYKGPPPYFNTPELLSFWKQQFDANGESLHARREFDLSQRFHHRAFVKIESIGMEKGRTVLKMEYLVGSKLAPNMLKRQELLQVMIDYVGALNEAFKLGWVQTDYGVNCNMLIEHQTHRLRLFDLENFETIDDYCSRRATAYENCSKNDHLNGYFRSIKEDLVTFTRYGLTNEDAKTISDMLEETMNCQNPLDCWETRLAQFQFNKQTQPFIAHVSNLNDRVKQ